ncbi:hypothetical protein AJ80_00545 [Polytolypa hystricis UAMH7299]|uniref:YCII-related domain-containing protein n=1 Tax=Polytolypa hystricis (strain UAMH7299) TaxID=1447883 RepID=A0A2B7Z4K0_POLH7|nr:hypothetical protein AJ80_00545 [Polytolypa hystricis UAMH7299]
MASAPAKCDWLILLPDQEGAMEKRLSVRPRHFDGMQPRVDSGAWKMGGATLDEPPAEGSPLKFNGSFIVAHAATKEEALEEIKKDVYATSGVWDLDNGDLANAGLMPVVVVFGGKITIFPLKVAFIKP